MWGSNEVLLHYSNLIYPGAMNAFHMIFISRLVSHRMWNTFKYKKRLSIRRKLHFKKQQNHQFLDKWRGFNFCCHSSADKLATVWAQIAFVAINWIKLKYSEVVLSWHHIDMFVYESLTNNIKRPNRMPLPNKPKTWNLFYGKKPFTVTYVSSKVNFENVVNKSCLKFIERFHKLSSHNFWTNSQK